MQTYLLDDSPLADLWGDSLNALEAAQCVPAAFGVDIPTLADAATDERTDAQARRQPEASPTNVKTCLHCGKWTGLKLFCSRGCRRAWQAGMNRWADQVVATKIVNAEGEELF